MPMRAALRWSQPEVGKKMPPGWHRGLPYLPGQHLETGAEKPAQKREW